MYFFRGKIFSLLLCLAIFFPAVVLAGPGRTGAQILNLGGGARARALGDALSAMSGDVTAVLWNPSGLADMSDSKIRAGRKAAQGSLSYTDYATPFGEPIGALYYAIVSGAIPLGDVGTIGATLQMQEQGTITVPTDSWDIYREVSLGTNFALTFSYANRITESVSAGINGKVIRMVLGSESGSSSAVDLGMQYLLPFDPIPTTLGVAIQNVGPGISFIDENQADPLPRLLRMGASINLYQAKLLHIHLVSGVTAYVDTLAEDEHELTVDLDRLNAKRKEKLTREQLLSDRGVGIRAFEWRHLQKNLGLECWIADMFAFRGGYKFEPGTSLSNLTDLSKVTNLSKATDYLLSSGFTFGVGVKTYLFNIDLSYSTRVGQSKKGLIEATGTIVF